MFTRKIAQHAPKAHRLAGTNPIGRRALVPTVLSSTAALHTQQRACIKTSGPCARHAHQHGTERAERGWHTSHGRICARCSSLGPQLSAPGWGIVGSPERNQRALLSMPLQSSNAVSLQKRANALESEHKIVMSKYAKPSLAVS